MIFFFSSRRRHTRSTRDWSSDVCSSDLSATACVASGALSRGPIPVPPVVSTDRKSTRLNSSHEWISYAVFCLKKKRWPNCPLRSGTKPALNKITERVSPYPSALKLSQPSRMVRTFFYLKDTTPTKIYPLSLPDALPI